jgi:hypothetical protein
MNNYKEKIMDYFGWKTICDKNCLFPSLHTHELSDIDNKFRNLIDFKELLKYKCNCGNHLNQNDFKLCYEAWGCSLGMNKYRFESRFICSKCKFELCIPRLVSLSDILKASGTFTHIS